MTTTSKRSGRENVAHDQIEAMFDDHELSRIIRRSIGSVRRDRLLGKGCPYVKIGALVRYRPSDVRTFIERNLRPGQH